MPVVIDSLDSDKYVVQTQTESTQNQIRNEPVPPIKKFNNRAMQLIPLTTVCGSHQQSLDTTGGG